MRHIVAWIIIGITCIAAENSPEISAPVDHISQPSADQRSWLHIMEEKRRLEKVKALADEKQMQLEESKNPQSKKPQEKAKSQADQSKIDEVKNHANAARKRVKETIAEREKKGSPFSQQEIDKMYKSIDDAEQNEIKRIVYNPTPDTTKTIQDEPAMERVKSAPSIELKKTMEQ